MNNSIVIHVNSEGTHIAHNPEVIPVVIINFDYYGTLPNMGSENAMIECPKCQEHGSQFDWNAATCNDFCGPITAFTRIQDAEAGLQFTCAYCYETSTTEELGLTKRQKN